MIPGINYKGFPVSFSSELMTPFVCLKSNPDLGLENDRFLRLKKFGYKLVDIVKPLSHVRYKILGLQIIKIQHRKARLIEINTKIDFIQSKLSVKMSVILFSLCYYFDRLKNIGDNR